MWSRKIDRVHAHIKLLVRVFNSEADIFHFHDPELIYLGLLIKFIRRKIVIYDVHENVVQQIRAKKWVPWYLRSPLASTFQFLERLAMERLDKIILAEDSYTEFVPRNHIVLHNYPFAPNYQSKSKDIDAIYVGGVLVERGAMEMLQIAREVKVVYPEFRMEIIGPIERNLLKNMKQFILDQDLKENVRLRGRIPNNEAMGYVSRSRIGLAILYPIKNYVTSIPTKLLEYMQYGIPFISSDFPYWESLISEVECGYFIQNDDVTTAAKIIVELLGDQEKAKKMGQLGRQVVVDNYSWYSEERILLKTYNELITS